MAYVHRVERPAEQSYGFFRSHGSGKMTLDGGTGVGHGTVKIVVHHTYVELRSESQFISGLAHTLVYHLGAVCGTPFEAATQLVDTRRLHEDDERAVNRAPRTGEADGVSYHFLSTEAFLAAVADGSFVEWEEVYPGRFYGTLRSEIDRKTALGRNVILDIDVKGALNVKPEKPPWTGNDSLRRRLRPCGGHGSWPIRKIPAATHRRLQANYGLSCFSRSPTEQKAPLFCLLYT